MHFAERGNLDLFRRLSDRAQQINTFQLSVRNRSQWLNSSLGTRRTIKP